METPLSHFLNSKGANVLFSDRFKAETVAGAAGGGDGGKTSVPTVQINVESIQISKEQALAHATLQP